MLNDEQIVDLLDRMLSIAVVGASSNPARDSHTAVSYLAREGFKVYPVNPNEREVEGLRAYPDVAALPERVDVVDVFRRPEHTPAVAREAAAAGARALWLQSGIASAEAASIAQEAGLAYVEDRCLFSTHRIMRRGGYVGSPRAVVSELAANDRFDWVGIYWVAGEELVLGPYAGAHPEGHERIRIPEGVTGSVAASGVAEVVPDVRARRGHIACDIATRSEMVVPIHRDGRVAGVLDVDSHTLDAFGAAEVAAVEGGAARLSR
jgi:predicted CoA-binding protein/putative methionine-R-sulfoxide reductase with GAF domain